MQPIVKSLRGEPLTTLLRAPDRAENLIVELQTHAAFLKLRTLENTQDQPAKASRDEVDADENVLEAAIHSRLRSLPGGSMASLGRYAYLARMA